MVYDVDYFINKFQAIPLYKWTIRVFKNFDGTRCAMGHCLSEQAINITTENFIKTGKNQYKPSQDECQTLFAEAHALCLLFNPDDAGEGSITVYDINNGDDPRYQQPTPKQRILAALYDIKKMQQPTPEEKKERIVYVSVPVSVTEQVKELVMS